MQATLFDDTRCQLGEGPLWHPEREQLFWFDILNGRLHTREENTTRTWQFDEFVSAAGWVSRDELLIASESKIFVFNLRTGTSTPILALEADNPATRSNDGRADPWGGFWIGTMGKGAEAGAGAIYRFYKGELRCIVPDLTITNAICFSPDRRYAYYADTADKRILRQPLDPDDGWLVGKAEIFLDLSGEDRNPDGAVVDSAGNLWNAQWASGRVAVYDPGGRFIDAVQVPGAHSSCPAFGGPDLATLYCTTAQQGISQTVLDAEPAHGQTFACATAHRGQAEHRVIL